MWLAIALMKIEEFCVCVCATVGHCSFYVLYYSYLESVELEL